MHCATTHTLRPSLLRRLLVALTAGGLACGVSFAAQDAAVTAAAGDPVVELPKFVVTDNRELPPPEAWRYGEIPGFEILTNASDKATQRLIRDFELFKQALGYAWPLPERGNVPVTLILCGKGAKFDAFVPKGKPGIDKVSASLFLRNRERTAIVIDLQAKSLNIAGSDITDDAATGTDSTQISIDHDKQLYREYVRYLLSRSEPRLPAWLEEGICQIIMRMKVDPREIVIGELEDPNTVSVEAAMIANTNALLGADDPNGFQLAGAPAEDRDFNAALRRKALVPWDKFFAVKHDSPEALNPLGNNAWSKQAYAFVHMCIYGENKRYQKAFGNYIVRATKEPVTEALFKECFGKTYKDMAITLRGYIDFTVYQKQMFVAKSKETGLLDPPKLALRDATEAEVGRIKGEAMLLAGHNDRAKTELTSPYIRGERDPQLLAALGLFEQTNGQADRARKFIEAAVKAKVPRRPRAYLEAARYRYADIRAKQAGKEMLTLEQATSIVEPLLVARTQRPSMVEVYELMAEVWMRSATPPTRDNVVFVIEGVRLYQGHLKLLYQAALLASQVDMVEAAHSLCEWGIKVGPDAKTKGAFEKLKASLPPDPAAALAAPGSTPAPTTAPAPKKS